MTNILTFFFLYKNQKKNIIYFFNFVENKTLTFSSSTSYLILLQIKINYKYNINGDMSIGKSRQNLIRVYL